ncbi:hypothetical protein ACFX2H_012992 [Malus domestica]
MEISAKRTDWIQPNFKKKETSCMGAQRSFCMEGYHLPIVPSDGSRDGSRFVDDARMVINKATLTYAHQQPPGTVVQVVADFLKVQTTATIPPCLVMILRSHSNSHEYNNRTTYTHSSNTNHVLAPCQHELKLHKASKAPMA